MLIAVVSAQLGRRDSFLCWYNMLWEAGQAVPLSHAIFLSSYAEQVPIGEMGTSFTLDTELFGRLK